MVESEAQELPEDIMLGAVVFGHEQMKVVIDAIDELVRDGGKPEVEWAPPAKNEELIAAVTRIAEPELRKAYQIRQKQARSTELRHIYDNVSKTLAAEAQDKGVSAPDSVEVGNIMFDLEAKIVRSQILDGEPRIDGRDTRTRPSDHDPYRCIAQNARFRPVYPWRNTGSGRCNTGHLPRQPENRRPDG